MADHTSQKSPSQVPVPVTDLFLSATSAKCKNAEEFFPEEMSAVIMSKAFEASPSTPDQVKQLGQVEQ